MAAGLVPLSVGVASLSMGSRAQASTISNMTVNGLLRLVGSSPTSKVMADERGEYQEYPGVSPLRWGQASGTAAAPITVGRPNVKISRRENISSAEMPNPAANDRNAALQVVSFGTLESAPQVAAGHFIARGGGTTSGADVNAISGVGIVSNTGAKGFGMGAYFEGRREVATANHYGVEITANNQTSTAPVYDPTGTISRGGVGVWLVSRGALGSDNAVGVQLAGQDGSEWLYALAAGGADVIKEALIRDDTDAPYSYLIKGTHGIAAIAVAAGAGKVLIGKEAGAVSGSVLEVGNALTVTQDKRIGLFGAEPVAQPRGYSPPYDMATLGKLIEDLKGLGLVAA